jgi:hypothetical protein
MARTASVSQQLIAGISFQASGNHIAILLMDISNDAGLAIDFRAIRSKSLNILLFVKYRIFTNNSNAPVQSNRGLFVCLLAYSVSWIGLYLASIARPVLNLYCLKCLIYGLFE